MKSRWAMIVMVVMCAGQLLACARRPMLKDPVSPTRADVSVDRSLRLEPGVYDVATGEQITREQLLSRLGEARFVVLGETHDDAFHHRVQHQVYEALGRRAQASGHAVLLGMEMMQVPFQAPLDAYVRGEIEQAQMLEQVEWEKRWRFPVAFYEPLWQLARAQGWPVVALNVPLEITRLISQRGLDGLTRDERAQVAREVDLESAPHREWFAQVFITHGIPIKDKAALDRFYEAQVSWDETMAQSAVRALEGRPPADQMVIVAGSGHVMNRWGIPSRIARRAPDAAILTLIPISAPVSSARSLAGATGATEQDLATWQSARFADFVWVE
jgi:uncharacterized iron-regulated protein